MNQISQSMESNIIAYFDGRLPDDESAELLHRVSVSPEIRQVFEGHKTLRQLASRAARSTAISPALEETLLARIAAMERGEELPAGFWNLRRASAVMGIAAILLLFLVGTMEFQTSRITPTANFTGMTAGHNSIVTTVGLSPSLSSSSFEIESSNDGNIVHHAAARAFVPDVANAIMQNNSSAPEETIPISIAPTPRGSDKVMAINMPGVANEPLLSGLSTMHVNDGSQFELGFSANTGEFVEPVSIPIPNPILSDFSIRGGYNIDVNDQVGLKYEHGFMDNLSSIAVAQTGFMAVNGVEESNAGNAGGIFYKRREVVGGLYFISLSIGGGLYGVNGMSGTYFGAEAALEMPFSDHILGGVSLVLNRLHQNSPQATYSEPVIYYGSMSMYNTLSGSIQYSLAYRF